MTLILLYLWLVQAVEFLAEWSLTPSNMTFLRVNTGVCDPRLIGDKHKWYLDELDTVTFKVWQEGRSLGATLRAATAVDNPPTGVSLATRHNNIYIYINILCNLHYSFTNVPILK